MKKELSFLLLSACFVKLPGASRWHRSVADRLRTKYGRHFSLNKVYLNFSGLTIVGLFFFDEQKDCTVRIKTLRLHGWAFRKIEINGMTVDFCTQAAHVAAREAASAASAPHSLDKLQAIYPVLHRALRLLVMRTPRILRVNDLSLSIHTGESLKGSLRVGCLTALKNPGSGLLSLDAGHGGVGLSWGAHSISLAALSAKIHYHVQGPDSIKCTLSVTTGITRLRSPVVIFGKELVIDPLVLQLTATSGTKGLSVHKGAYFNFNKTSFAFSYDHWIDRDEHLALHVKLQYCTVNDFLYSFPDFTSAAIYSVSFAGGFGFEAGFKLGTRHPFFHEVDFKPVHDLAVSNWGNLDLRFLQEPFMHSMNDNGRPAKRLELDPANDRFTRIEDISPYVKDAVVFAEDSEFYDHHGVCIDSLGAALRRNIITGKVTSGGSTITMQLVKNLFLNHEKNLYRKIEEYFLSWLLTDFVKIGKDRQLEIYLNIIEFGPGIYGITEASEYYFSKKPAALTLTEALVITYIIPRPKFFHEALLEKTPQLIKRLGLHLEGASRRLLNNRFISFVDFGSLQFEVRFSSGLGTLFLHREMDHLHATLRETYLNALRLWLRRYKGKPCPFVSCAATLDACKNEASLEKKDSPKSNVVSGGISHVDSPSLAFDVAFKDIYGQPRLVDNLFVSFAALVREIDIDEKVKWGGELGVREHLCHFELIDRPHLNNMEY